MLRIIKSLMPSTRQPPSDEIVHTPGNYILTDNRVKENTSQVNFYVVGCGGNGGQAQKDVAKLMNEIAAGSRRKPKFIIILGDNFYDSGVDSPTDPIFESNFYKVYRDPSLRAICDIPCFVIPGNHDHNVHKLGSRGGNIDFHKIAAQIQHTFLTDGKVDEAKVEMYKGEELDLARLPKWNMPHRFGVYVMEEKENNLAMFCIDATTYGKDYLDLLLGDENPNNQAAWLGREVKKHHHGAIRLLFLHNPLYTAGKLTHGLDAYLYLSEKDIATLAKLGFTGNYSSMLSAILHAQGLDDFEAVFSAHTHSMVFQLTMEKGKKLCQVIAGGGGGKLESRQNFASLPLYMENYGFVEVQADLARKKLKFGVRSTDGQYVEFTNQSTEPVRDRACAEEDDVVKHLGEIIKDACREYHRILATKEAAILNWHGSAGAQRADELINFFNRFEPIASQDEAFQFVLGRMLQLWFSPGADSLVTLILNRCGLSYAEFMKNQKLFRQRVIETMPPAQVSQAEPRPIPVLHLEEGDNNTSPRIASPSVSSPLASSWEHLSPRLFKSSKGGRQQPLVQSTSPHPAASQLSRNF